MLSRRMHGIDEGVDIGTNIDVDLKGSPYPDDIPIGGYYWNAGIAVSSLGTSNLDLALAEFEHGRFAPHGPRVSRTPEPFTLTGALKLAEVSLHPDGLLSFANRYGSLGTPLRHFHPAKGKATTAETYRDWRWRVEIFQECVRAYAATPTKLLEHWKPSDRFVRCWAKMNPEQALATNWWWHRIEPLDALTDDPGIPGIKQRTFVDYCRTAPWTELLQKDLIGLVNANLALEIHSRQPMPCVLCDECENNGLLATMPYVNREIQFWMERGSDGRIRQTLVPDGILTAAWLEFANLLAANGPLKRCEVCNYFLDVSDRPNMRLVHRKCGGTRRTQRYRNKKRAGRRKAAAKDV